MAINSRELTVSNQQLEPVALSTKAVWAGAGSQMTVDQARALAMIGEHYNLDPALGEVMILGSKVYITLAGYEAVAHRNPLFEGLETWPLSEQERKDGKIAADEHAWGCRVYRKGWRVPAVDWGVASERNVQAGPLKVFAREIAKARAVRRTLKLAFGLSLPDPDEAIDLDTGEIITQAPLAGVDVAEPKVRDIAPNWGHFWIKTKELGLSKENVHAALRVESVTQWPYSLAEALDICQTWQYQQAEAKRRSTIAAVEQALEPFEPSDDEWEALDPSRAGGDESPRAEVEQAEPEAPTTTRTEKPIPDVTNFGQLWGLALKDFGLSKSAALKELGARSQDELGMSPRDAYAQLAEINAGRLAL